MKNQALQFETLAEAKAIARQLVAHIGIAIAIKGKGKKVAASITPDVEENDSSEAVYHLLDAAGGERLCLADVDAETFTITYADNERLEFTDVDDARAAAEAILAVCDLSIHIVDGDENLVEKLAAADAEIDSDDDITDTDKTTADESATGGCVVVIDAIKSPDLAKRQQRTGKKSKPSLDDVPEDDPQPTLL